MPLIDINTFSNNIGLEGVKWEDRGQQYVSQLYTNQSDAEKIATVMNKALSEGGEDEDTIQVVKSSTNAGYMVLVANAPIHDIFFQTFNNG